MPTVRCQETDLDCPIPGGSQQAETVHVHDADAAATLMQQAIKRRVNGLGVTQSAKAGRQVTIDFGQLDLLAPQQGEQLCPLGWRQRGSQL